MTKEEKKILEMCNNGTHSCFIQDLLKETGFTKLELWNCLQLTKIKWRICENINGKKLLVIVG